MTGDLHFYCLGMRRIEISILAIFKDIRRHGRISKWQESSSRPEAKKVRTWRWMAGSSFSGTTCHWCLGNILRLSFSPQYVSFIACRRAGWLSNVTSYACRQIRAVISALRHVVQSEIFIRTWLRTRTRPLRDGKAVWPLRFCSFSYIAIVLHGDVVPGVLSSIPIHSDRSRRRDGLCVTP